MSFWPFSNSLSSNSKLQKFLDSVLDPSSVSVEDLVQDLELLLELVNELHNIKGNYGKNASNFPFQQHLQQQQLQQKELPLAVHLEEDNNNNSNNNNNNLTPMNSVGDSASVSSYSETGNNLSKDARGAKLLEILIQPHILNGFLDYIVDSVSFFHELEKEEERKIRELTESKDDISTETSSIVSQADDVDGVDNLDDIVVESVLGNKDNHNENHGEHDNGVDDDVVDDDEEDEDEDEDDETAEEKLRRFIQVSSDVLSIDLWIISNRIIETPVIISKLWLILSLPHLLEASPSVTYLVHILDQLMDANSIELLNFIRRQHNLVDTFLDKIEIPMLMDFFLRIIQTDKLDSPTGILDTLLLQELIPKLIEILKPQTSQFPADGIESSASGILNPQLFFKQTAATDFIKALVTISSNAALAINLDTNIGPNQLTRELVSKNIVDIMVNEIILYDPPAGAGTNKHGINNCVGIIIELIRKNNSDYDSNCGTYSSMLTEGGGHQGGEGGAGSEVNSYVMFQWLKDFEQNPPGSRDPIYLGEMLEIFSENLANLSELMDKVPEGSKELGFTNFKISELIAELLHCSNMILLNSKKIKKVVKIREYVRSQQNRRIKRALNDLILTELDNHHSEGDVMDVTHGLDDVSLDNISIGSRKIPRSTPNEGVDGEGFGYGDDDDNDIDDVTTFELSKLSHEDEDSDDEEPVISAENPFVCKERDIQIRANPCIGDKFKIDLVDLGILQQIVNKFTNYPWHNFFHNVVFDLIQQIFNGKLNSYNSFLIVELFKEDKCNLTGLIYDAYKSTIEPRPGYMGHLVLVSEEIVKFTSLYKPDLISPIIVTAVTLENWEWFVNEVLLKTREVYNSVLGADLDEEGEAEMRKGRRSNGEDGEDEDDDDDGFGFDSSGYLDLESYEGGENKIIILGDKENHESFINDKSNLSEEDEEVDGNDDEDDDDDDEMMLMETHMPSVSAFSPTNSTGEHDYIENQFLENMSGSSSSEEEENSPGVEESNELRRVPKHNKK